MNVLPAVVRDVTFAGETHRYLLEAEFGAFIVLKQQHRFNVRSHLPTEPVVIEWHVEDTLVV
jgi:TOBE domain